MTERKVPVGAKILLAWWIIVLVFGFFGNFWLAAKAFETAGAVPGLIFSALGIGCGVLLYRTYKGRNEFRGGW